MSSKHDGGPIHELIVDDEAKKMALRNICADKLTITQLDKLFVVLRFPLSSKESCATVGNYVDEAFNWYLKDHTFEDLLSTAEKCFPNLKITELLQKNVEPIETAKSHSESITDKLRDELYAILAGPITNIQFDKIFLFADLPGRIKTFERIKKSERAQVALDWCIKNGKVDHLISAIQLVFPEEKFTTK